MNRRKFVQSSASTAGLLLAPHAPVARLLALPETSVSKTSQETPKIDTHIHLYDPTRPGGIPWPERSDKAIFWPALPPRLEQVSAGLGIVGAIAIEASPLTTDNDWVLDIAAKNPLMVGLVGDLVPGSGDYLPSLDRLHRNPLFLGIRYGNLWGRDLAADLGKPGFLDGLKALAQAGLVLESANPDPRLISALADIASRIPTLTVVVDHLPHATPPTDPNAFPDYNAALRNLGQASRVFIKLSEILTDGNTPGTPAHTFSTAKLDNLWSLFGEDKVLFGSDWPNSEHFAHYPEVLSVAQSYISTKGLTATENFFWRNSIDAYGWKPRTPSQRIASNTRKPTAISSKA